MAHREEDIVGCHSVGKGDILLFYSVCWLPDRLLWLHGAMPRTARASIGGICYHVLNRGNARQDVFNGPIVAASGSASLIG